jgi:hypothetical protein
MRIAPGKVVGGRVELDAELPEGASVTVWATDADQTFELDAATEKMVLESIAEARNGHVTPLEGVITDMRGRE